MPKPKFDWLNRRHWQDFYREAKRTHSINHKMMLHIQANDLMAVEACIRKGADVNCCLTSGLWYDVFNRFDGFTPVHMAVLYGRLEILHLLIVIHGAKADNTDRYRLTPLDYITTKQWNEPEEDFIHWNKKRTRQMIECLVRDGGADINRLGDRDGAGNWTPFHEAVANNRLDVAKTLFAEGADVHLPGPEKTYCDYCTDDCVTTPLYSAGRHASPTMTDFLVNECNANVNAIDSVGMTPLIVCCQRNPIDLDSIKCLVHDGNADISIRDFDRGETALHRACKFCKDSSWPILKFLIFDCGMDVNARNSKKGWTPIFHLVQDRFPSQAKHNYRLGFVKKMVEVYGANPILVDDNGDTVLHIVCRPNEEYDVEEDDKVVVAAVETVRYLVESCGLHFHAKNQKGESPFFLACQNPEAIEILRYSLAQNPALRSAKDDYGNTLLHLLCYAYNHIAVNFLLFELELTAEEIDTKNAYGRTALKTVINKYNRQRSWRLGSIMRSIRDRKFRIRQEEQNWMRYLLTNGLGSGSNRQGLGAECAERMIEFL